MRKLRNPPPQLRYPLDLSMIFLYCIRASIKKRFNNFMLNLELDLRLKVPLLFIKITTF